jgi:ubiquitin C-terminal hydrolase
MGSIEKFQDGRVGKIGGITQVGSGDALNIYHCLELFRKPITLEKNKWYCKKCKANREGTYQ